jgi:hypothetical protein
MKFKYRDYGDTRRPVIPVVLSYGKISMDYEVLIDSGSDRCFFDIQVGKTLGIIHDGSRSDAAYGIGGKASLYYSHPVTITIKDISYSIEAGFMPSVMGGIVPYGLVGQKGFFDKFVVKFNLPKNEIEVIEAKK